MLHKLLLFVVLLSMNSLAIAELPSGPAQRNRDLMPDYYPHWFQGQGFLQQVNLKQRLLLIDSTAYALDPNLIVHTITIERATLNVLRSGMELGFNFSGDDRSTRRLKEIWILPQGTLIPH